jgi:hypothetical protein
MLRNVKFLLVSDVSGQPVASIFKGPAVQKEYREHVGVQLHGNDVHNP